MWDEPYLFKISVDGLIHRCIAGEEAIKIMWHYHSSAMKATTVGKEQQLKYFKVDFNGQPYSMNLSCMFKSVLNSRKQVTSQKI